MSPGRAIAVLTEMCEWRKARLQTATNGAKGYIEAELAALERAIVALAREEGQRGLTPAPDEP